MSVKCGRFMPDRSQTSNMRKIMLVIKRYFDLWVFFQLLNFISQRLDFIKTNRFQLFFFFNNKNTLNL